MDLSRADYPISPDADPIGNQSATEGSPTGGRTTEPRSRCDPTITIISAADSLPVCRSHFSMSAGTKDQIGSFIPADFPFEWLRTQVELLKRVRPYYYGDYYPLLPCSSSTDCATDTSNERSAAFEWAAWQFNRPEQEDGMVQAFRRKKSADPTKDLRLRGLDPAATYEVTDFDTEVREHDFGQRLDAEGSPCRNCCGTRRGDHLLQESSLT